MKKIRKKIFDFTGYKTKNGNISIVALQERLEEKEYKYWSMKLVLGVTLKY